MFGKDYPTEYIPEEKVSTIKHYVPIHDYELLGWNPTQKFR